MHVMCGRVIQASPPDQLGLKIIDALDPRDSRVTGTAMATGKRELIGQMQRRRPLMFSSRNDGQRFMSIDE